MLSLLCESTCLGCGEPSSGVLCETCGPELQHPLRVIAPGTSLVQTAQALGDYGGVAGALVRAAKFGGDERAARLLLRAGRTRFGELAAAADLIVAVPTTPWRWLARGAHLPERLALALGTASGTPVVPALRRRWGPAQSSLSTPERLTRADAAFEARFGVGGCVLLVDDVATTGATARACAAELLAAGAQRVDLVVAASSRRGFLTASEIP
jgi:predicted amidophosphoribosyltransferase